MKIGILAPISHPIPPRGYGPWEKVVYTLAEGLHQKGHDVTVFATNQTSGSFKIHATVPNTTSELQEKYRFPYELHHISQVLNHLQTEKFDIIHNNLNWYGFLGLSSSNLPFVTTLHGMEDQAKFIYDQYKNSNFVSISNAMRAYKPDLNYVATVYNGINFETFKTVSPKENYFITASRICVQKGIHHAIALAQQTTTPLLIAGTIDDPQYFEKAIKPHLDGTSIVYLGELSQLEVHEKVARARAYISILEWEEPFGLSVAEAIASGTPVIANRRGSMPELVKDQVSGIIIDTVDEAVQRIAEIDKIDNHACRAYGEGLFSIDKMISGYVTVYKKIVR